MASPTVNFRSIRKHDGSQHRGFEELACQLIPWIDEISGHQVVRHGTPDAGVEALVKFDDGSVWAWQAKYFFELKSTQISQLKRSFETALAAVPALARYTFVLPFNPPAGNPGKGKSAKDKLDDAIARWQKEAKQEGRDVEIRWVGESRLLDILTADEHVGRVRYWFDSLLVFSNDWLRTRIDDAVSAAGARYTPAINVELPVAFAFEGLGRTQAFGERLGSCIGSVSDSARTNLRLRTAHPGLTKSLRTGIEKAFRSLQTLVADLGGSSIEGAAPLDWGAELTRLEKLRDRLDDLEQKLARRADDLRSQQSDREGKRGPSTRSPVVSKGAEEARFGVMRIRDELQGLIALLHGEAAQLVTTPILFLIGQAGTGKTHLLCDVARRRIDEGRPTVLVLGQQLVGQDDPWTLVLRSVGLPDLTSDEFLGALDTAGELAGTRAVLIVDAINEGRGLDIWPPYLRSIADQIARYPHVGLVLSCRSSYVQAMLPRDADISEPRDLGFIQLEHVGFAGYEWEAARRFFGHYGLTLPDFPLLVPEFTNPLFLKLLCDSLHRAGETTLPRGATGITALFDRFLGEVNRELARGDRCNYRPGDDLVAGAVRSFAKARADADSDWLPFAEFEDICNQLLPNRSWSKSLQAGLLEEGVVARDLIGDGEIARLSYQRLGDHFEAAALLAEHDDAALRSYLAELAEHPAGLYRRSGLLEALAVLLPEEHRQELHELVSDAHDEVIGDAFLGSIIWRAPQSFPEDLSLDYLNILASRRIWYHDLVLETLLHVACVPDHPLNAELLDVNLARRPLADRDSWWTTYINEASPEESVVYRIVDWARSSQQDVVADDAARLAALMLAWFLTASNRGLRDRATKALINLLRERLSVLADLLDHFADVDDPYVAERLYAVAYGCALATTDEGGLQTLADTVFDHVFADGHPPVHVLLRDYARGVVETAADRGILSPQVALDRVRPPYSSPWPARPPSQEQLDRRAPLETHGTLHGSLSSALADFARYTVGIAVNRFEATSQSRRRRDRNDEAQRAAAAAGRTPDTPVMFATDAAARWVFGRVLRLGWTPARFGDYDRMVGRYRSYRGEGLTERIGKKYQWIALHELVARIADHCRYRSWSLDDSVDYEGPWQLSLRDIDPTIAFEPSSAPAGQSPVTWWQPIDIQIARFGESSTRDAWSLSATDVPTADELQRLLRVERPDGLAWLTLEGHYGWKEELPPHLKSAYAPRALLWLQVRSYLIPRRSFPEIVQWARRQDWFGRWMPEGPDVGQSFLGEWPWHASASEHSTGPEPIHGREYQAGEAPGTVRPTWANYSWGGGDASLPDWATTSLLADWPTRRLGLRWMQGDFAFADAAGEAVAFDPAGQEPGTPALLLREDAARRLLDESGSSLLWTILGEKNIDGTFHRREKLFVISGVGAFESSGADLEVTVKHTLHG